MASHGVLVSCRVRDAELIDQESTAVRVGADAASVVVAQGDDCDASSYAYFDVVFPPTATQEQVFASVGAPFVDEVLAGYNYTILAYGQTGSGKTHTTVGGATAESRGIIPRALELLLTRTGEIAATGEFEVALTASFVEIYQEKLRDLLVPLNSSRLCLREEKSRGVWVEGAASICVDSVETGMALLVRGTSHRSTGRTAMNADSSRSHSVLLLTLTKRRTNATTSSGLNLSSSSSTMSIVDLAGSERAQKTSASGVRLDEAKHINRSLSALGNVINALADGKLRHVPYRDSVLTRLLQTSLGGNAKTHLLLTCSSSSVHVDETLSTLRFGARAKRVINSPHVNTLEVEASDSAQHQRLLQTLRDKVESLGCYIRELEATRCTGCRRPRSGSDDLEPIQTTSCRCNSVDSTDGVENIISDQESSPTEQECVSALHKTDLRASCGFDLDGSTISPVCSISDDIANDVFQAEMRSLRKALADLSASHIRCVSDPATELPASPDESHARIAELEAQLDRLTVENDRLGVANRGLRAKVSRLDELLRLRDEGNEAETEILRRRLESTEERFARLQAELTAALVQHEECRALLTAKHREASDLQAQLQQRPPETLDLGNEDERDCKVTVTKRHQRMLSTRLTTADELTSPSWRSQSTSRREDGDQGAQCGAGMRIQTWWSGDESCDPASTKRGSASSPLPLEPSGAPKRCGTPSEAVRPLRARLVGLLASLEEETTAFRGLLVDAPGPPVAVDGYSQDRAKKTGRRMRGLPSLSAATRDTTSFDKSEKSDLVANDTVAIQSRPVT